MRRFPPETLVPPHIHPDQDEYLYILEGQFDFFLDGAETQATPGDLVRLPMGKPHGIFTSPAAPRRRCSGYRRRGGSTICFGDPQHEGADAGRGGGARRRAQHPLPAPPPGA